MSAHVRVLVPLGAGRDADVGLVAQALLYFDRVALHAASPDQLASFIDWFVAPGEVETFLIYLRDGVFEFVDVAADGAFRQRVLEHPSLAALLKGQWRHARLLSYGTARVLVPEPATSTVDEDPASSLLRIASALDADLCLPSPLDRAVGERLAATVAAERVVEGVDVTLTFPDARRLVASGRFGVREVLDLRRATRPLRDALQAGAGLDRFLGLHATLGDRFAGNGSLRLSMFGAAPAGGQGEAPSRWRPLVLGEWDPARVRPLAAE